MIACGAGASALAPSAHAQAITAHPAITSSMHLSPVAAVPDHAGPANGYGRIGNSDGQCLDADSNHWRQNGDNVQLWACNNHGEQLWTVSGAHIVNADGQCLDADSNHWGQNGDNVQLWACNNHGEQIWPQE
jgi:Ricin-type beta-trefoil lectin domain